MRKMPPGTVIMCEVSMRLPLVSVPESVLSCRTGAGRRDEIQRRPRRDEALLLGALLEVPHDPAGVLHDPPPHERLVDGLPLLRIFWEVDDPGESERDLGVVEVLLALEADLELRPLHRVQFLVQPDEGALPA